ncbi:MAG TPA: histidine phosphatase family protein [Pyrinomonadaceae bacterium]|nr:histidine phosphatase family protein [Pyrinomonadaceae bacterium]
MKTLYVLRHAKSSWEDSDLADFDRPLSDRGKTAAPFMGEVMKRNEFAPEIILASPATRARETARLVKESAGLPAEIKHNERIYEASPQTLQHVAASVDDRFNSAMIVGHNPGMEGFVRILTGRLEPMPTAALAVIDLDISGWEQISGVTGKLRKIIRPKDEMKATKNENAGSSGA